MGRRIFEIVEEQPDARDFAGKNRRKPALRTPPANV
jgi:hypothetical protein